MTLEANYYDFATLVVYHSYYGCFRSDSQRYEGKKKVEAEEVERGGGIKIHLKRSVFNANHRA